MECRSESSRERDAGGARGTTTRAARAWTVARGRRRARAIGAASDGWFSSEDDSAHRSVGHRGQRLATVQQNRERSRECAPRALTRAVIAAGRPSQSHPSARREGVGASASSSRLTRRCVVLRHDLSQTPRYTRFVMAHHKRRRPKAARAGCLLCKPHKRNGAKERERASVRRRVLESPRELADTF